MSRVGGHLEIEKDMTKICLKVRNIGERNMIKRNRGNDVKSMRRVRTLDPRDQSKWTADIA